MIYKTPQGEEVELKLKNTQTARFKRDSYFLIGDYNEAITKHPDNYMAAFAEFIYPEKDGEVSCRYKELFELFLEDSSKISYELDNENESRLRKVTEWIFKSFFGTSEPLAST